MSMCCHVPYARADPDSDPGAVPSSHWVLVHISEAHKLEHGHVHNFVGMGKLQGREQATLPHYSVP